MKNADFKYTAINRAISYSTPVGTKIEIDHLGNNSKWEKVNEYNWEHTWNNGSKERAQEMFLVSELTQALNGNGKVKIK